MEQTTQPGVSRRKRAGYQGDWLSWRHTHVFATGWLHLVGAPVSWLLVTTRPDWLTGAGTELTVPGAFLVPDSHLFLRLCGWFNVR